MHVFESSPEVLKSRPEARVLVQQLALYREPNNARGVFELTITAGPFFIIWALMWVGSGFLLTVLAAGLVVRLFMIQHDCGHGSFFHGRLANDWVGRAIGVVALTPYDYWRRNHARHHASSGNLDQRGVGDIDVLTVREFVARPRWRQIPYRLYRHPIVMFGIGPAYLFILRHRLPIGMMRNGWAPWLSTMGTNAAIAILLVHLPIMILAASIGVWLFYVQHQFEHTSWFLDEAWRFHEAALHGSSYYHLPGVLYWSRRTSASTTSITCAVEFLAIGCRMYCGITRGSPPSDELPCSRACSVHRSPCGTRMGDGWFHLQRRPYIERPFRQRPPDFRFRNYGRPGRKNLCFREHKPWRQQRISGHGWNRTCSGSRPRRGAYLARCAGARPRL
jgi:acyl-lipid omega-6 desaturase (Delta-12 desaturase)